MDWADSPGSVSKNWNELIFMWQNSLIKVKLNTIENLRQDLQVNVHRCSPSNLAKIDLLCKEECATASVSRCSQSLMQSLETSKALVNNLSLHIYKTLHLDLLNIKTQFSIHNSNFRWCPIWFFFPLGNWPFRLLIARVRVKEKQWNSF